MKFRILMFSLLFCLMFSATSLAAPAVIESMPSEILPLPVDSNFEESIYIVYRNGSGDLYSHIYDVTGQSDYSIGMSSSLEKFGAHFEKTTARHTFFFDLTSGEWVDKGSVSSSSDYTGQSITVLYDSNVDIYDSNGNLFFQVPPGTEELYQRIQRVATEELTIQNQTLVGTIRILVLCGVGLIALLVGLVLFGKVLNRYHLK